MTGSGNRLECRSEVRRPMPADRLAWTRDTAARVYTGWTNDLAASSIAFVTPSRDQPTPGEAIELRLGCPGRTPQHRRVRVVRIAPYDRFFSIVGCRREPAKGGAPST